LKTDVGPLLRSKEAVLCLDLDGPVLDVSDRYYELYCDLVSELADRKIKSGSSVLSKSDYWNLKRNRTREKEILRASGMTDIEFVDRYERLRQERIESKEYLRLDTPWAGVADALRPLRRKFVLIAASLRSFSNLLLEQLETLDLLDVFDDVVSGRVSDGTLNRGEAKARLISERYDAAATCGWFVGDTETDILAGKVLNWQTAGVSFGIRDENILMAAKPDVLLRTPDEMVDWLTHL
jgi:phosphoglycolate phosphatase-like HAD superfamily hydrolase